MIDAISREERREKEVRGGKELAPPSNTHSDRQPTTDIHSTFIYSRERSKVLVHQDKMDTTNTQPQPTTIEIATAEFHAGVTAVLRSWSALRTAVESEWGGVTSKDKAEFLRAQILDCFDYKKGKSSTDMYDLEDDLLIFLEEEFSITIEDDSEKQVALAICQMYEMCGNGDFSLSRQVVANANRASAEKRKVVVQTEGELDEDSDEEMDTEDDAGGDSTNDAQTYAGDFLFGAPAGQGKKIITGPPPRQLGQAESEKSEPEVDDDGFATVPTKRKGKK